MAATSRVVPVLQGCYTEGETEQEARELIEDAARLHVEDRLARPEPIHAEVGSSRIRIVVQEGRVEGR